MWRDEDESHQVLAMNRWDSEKEGGPGPRRAVDRNGDGGRVAMLFSSEGCGPLGGP